MTALLLKKLVSTVASISGSRCCNGGVTATKEELLPDDIIQEILSRLPAECVLKCRTVCKRWLLLTCSSSYFTELHRKRAKTPLLLMQNVVNQFADDENLELFIFDGCHKKGKRIREDGLFKVKRARGDKMRLTASSSDGLLVFGVDNGRRFQVCNFVTREQVNVETPLHMQSLFLLLYAIFLHPTTKEYMMLFSSRKPGQPDYYMYGLRSNSWRKVGLFHNKPDQSVNPVLFNNNLIWMISARENYSGCNHSIIMFDTVTEEFRTRPHPPQPDNKRCSEKHAFMYIFETKGKVQFCSAQSFKVQLWVLDDFSNWSWTKRQNVSVDVSVTIPFVRWRTWRSKFTVLKYMKAEHDNLLLIYERRLYVVDLNENKIVLKLEKNFKTSDNRLNRIRSSNISTFNLFWYTGTFVSIKGSSPPCTKNSGVAPNSNPSDTSV